jgi:TonB family protein
LFVGFPKIKVPPPAGKEQKISLNLSQFKTPPSAPKPVVVPPQPKPVPIQPPVPKPIVKPIIKPVEKIVKHAPVVKKKLIDDKKRIFVEKVEKEDNNITKTEPKKEKLAKKEKPVKKVEKKVQKKKVTKKRVVKQRKPQRKKSKNPLANALMGSGTSMYPTQRSSASSGSYSARMINQLYGKEFGTFSSTQKKFIKHNLGTIHRITQRTLNRNGYPEVAVRTRQEGTNVVSFYLHPNGDISGLRLKTRIGYAALDNNTLEVIRIAYKDYPLPNQKTKIVFYVQYSIY